MWAVQNLNLSMAEGDYGIALPVTVSGTTLGASDCLRMTFRATPAGEAILTKDFNTIINNTVELELTEEESALFAVGTYLYSLDWYQNGNFMCNIIPCSLLRVVDKI